jgi:hypothetical protein
MVVPESITTLKVESPPAKVIAFPFESVPVTPFTGTVKSTIWVEPSNPEGTRSTTSRGPVYLFVSTPPNNSVPAADRSSLV